MRYEIGLGRQTYHVDLQEIGPNTYDVTVDDGETVRIDAVKNPRTVYSILLGHRQYEGSVDEREDGTLDVHVGTSAFDFTAVDERRKLLTGSGSGVPTGVQTIRAQMPGKIVRVLVRSGDRVVVDQGLLIIEAMKMENEIKSPIDGVVAEVSVVAGDAVETNAQMLVVEPREDEG